MKHVYYLCFLEYLFLFRGLVIVQAMCPYPDFPSDGKFVPHQKQFTPGDQITYSCKKGFALSGKERRRCMSNDAWSGRTPFCDSSVSLSHPSISNRYANTSLLSRVIDGENETCYHWPSAAGHYMYVRLDKEIVVRTIRIFLRKGKTELEVLTVASRGMELCEKYDKSIERNQWVNIACNNNMLAKTVVIYISRHMYNSISLCEIEVYGKEEDSCDYPPASISNGHFLVDRSKAHLVCEEGYESNSVNRLSCEKNTSWVGAKDLRCDDPLSLTKMDIAVTPVVINIEYFPDRSQTLHTRHPFYGTDNRPLQEINTVTPGTIEEDNFTVFAIMQNSTEKVNEVTDSVMQNSTEKVNEVTDSVLQNSTEKVNEVTDSVLQNSTEKVNEVTDSVLQNSTEKVNEVTDSVMQNSTEKVNEVTDSGDPKYAISISVCIVLVLIFMGLTAYYFRHWLLERRKNLTSVRVTPPPIWTIPLRNLETDNGSIYNYDEYYESIERHKYDGVRSVRRKNSTTVRITPPPISTIPSRRLNKDDGYVCKDDGNYESIEGRKYDGAGSVRRENSTTVRITPPPISTIPSRRLNKDDGYVCKDDEYMYKDDGSYEIMK